MPFDRPPAQTGAEAALRDVVRELHRASRQSEDSAGAAKGTLASIGREEGQLVYLARACDHLTVTLCPHVVEKEALHALRSAGQNMRRRRDASLLALDAADAPPAFLFALFLRGAVAASRLR